MVYKISPLSRDETLFSNIDSLDPDFVPRVIPFRETEQKEIALALEPLLSGLTARNLLIYGKSGIGKTHAVLRVLDDFAELNIKSFVVNCWTTPNSGLVIKEISRQLGIPNDSDMQKIKMRINKPCVFVFDEIDKAEDLGFLYSFAEEIKTKGIVLISNKRDFFASVDERIRSRIMPLQIEFRQYTEKEISAILSERRKYAFYEGTWHKDAIALLEKKTAEKGDIRFGIAIMRYAGLNAEKEASRIVFENHVFKALEKVQ
ncbi:MAG: AAA family ATPase [Candidatus Diapherotrites archaeon]|nr:AAA family ATPase [Candidatus Diapherotrites archaeon]